MIQRAPPVTRVGEGSLALSLDGGDEAGDDFPRDGHGLGARHARRDAVVIECPEDDLVVQGELGLGIPYGADGRGKSIGILSWPKALIHLLENAGSGFLHSKIVADADHRPFVFVASRDAGKEAIHGPQPTQACQP